MELLEPGGRPAFLLELLTPVSMFSSTLPNQFIAREGEAPAEP